MGNEFMSSNSYSLLEQENIIESILFMMGESVSVDTLATAIESTVDVAKEAAERLYTKYQNEYQDRGMKVIKLGSKYQMVSNNKYFKNLVLVASHPQKPVITEAILETLSIIAYKQPISKPEIEHIRGVKSDYACNRLLEYGLIEERGRLETAGRPILFGTTEEFMLRFGIESLDQLPILDATKFAEIESEVEKELTETLGEPVKIEKDHYTESITSNQTAKEDGDNESENAESEDAVSNEAPEITDLKTDDLSVDSTNDSDSSTTYKPLDSLSNNDDELEQALYDDIVNSNDSFEDNNVNRKFESHDYENPPSDEQGEAPR